VVLLETVDQDVEERSVVWASASRHHYQSSKRKTSVAIRDGCCHEISALLLLNSFAQHPIELVCNP
jgi:hypothetical protein